MKKICLLLMIIFLTGCTCKYELEFNKDSIKETITSYVYETDYETPVPGTDPDDLVAHLVNDDQYPLVNSEDTYEKTVTDKGDYQEVVLKHEYDVDDFKNYSQVINCFENKVFDYKDGEYNIKLSGEFYCLYGDEIELVISSKNRITKSNGKKEFNTYTWTINNDNYRDLNIEVTISKDSVVKFYVAVCVVIIIISGLVVLGFKVFGKILNRNDVNKI